MANISASGGDRVYIFRPDKLPETTVQDSVPRPPDYLDAMKATILIQHGCRSAYRETVLVHEKTTGNDTLWGGPVSTFDLTRHKKAKTCFAWVQPDVKGKPTIFAVLGNRYVDSAKKAVRASVFTSVPPFSKPSKGLERLRKQLRISKRLLHDAQIKKEDLDASIAAAKEIHENILQNQNPPADNSSTPPENR